jgi:hypothetical protein
VGNTWNAHAGMWNDLLGTWKGCSGMWTGGTLILHEIWRTRHRAQRVLPKFHTMASLDKFIVSVCLVSALGPPWLQNSMERLDQVVSLHRPEGLPDIYSRCFSQCSFHKPLYGRAKPVVVDQT